MRTCKIKAFNNNERMSTQELLQLIYEKIDHGFVDFEIEACGQHDIAGALWAKDKKKDLNFRIHNPGQRVGAMALDGTKITVVGSSTNDVGWLNSGAEITVLGNAGDTAGHCAAGGKIYIAGSVGARSGALMKHDPRFEPPQLWVLKNTGSFSFEFMGGGVAVVCGYDCDEMPSVLGNRSCVGMVGGTIYARGKIEGLSDCVEINKLNNEDKEFLKQGLKIFLNEIEKSELQNELCDFSKWRKITPIANTEKTAKISVCDFRKKYWFKEGLFGDLVEDDGFVSSLVETGANRLKKPVFDKKKCVKCKLCINNCPNCAIVEQKDSLVSIDDKCTGCSICSTLCPKGAWVME